MPALRRARADRDEDRCGHEKQQASRWHEAHPVRVLLCQRRKGGSAMSHEIQVIQAISRLEQHVAWSINGKGRGQSRVDLRKALECLKTAYSVEWDGVRQSQELLNRNVEFDDPQLVYFLKVAVGVSEVIEFTHQLNKNLPNKKVDDGCRVGRKI